MRTKKGLYPQLEEHVAAWIKEVRNRGACVSGVEVLRRARLHAHEIGIDDQFKGSQSWLYSFFIRYNFTIR